MLVVIMTLISLTFGCKIYNYFGSTEILDDPVKGNMGKDKYVTKDGKVYNNLKEYADALLSTVKFVDVAADGSVTITLILDEGSFSSGFTGTPLYLYGNKIIMSKVATYDPALGTGSRDPSKHGIGAFAKFDGPTTFVEGTKFKKYTMKIPAPDSVATTQIDELMAADKDYVGRVGIWSFHFAANNPEMNQWDGKSGLFREFLGGNKSATTTYLRNYAPGYIGNDGTGFAQLRLDYTKLADGCKADPWKSYNE